MLAKKNKNEPIIWNFNQFHALYIVRLYKMFNVTELVNIRAHILYILFTNGCTLFNFSSAF